MTLEAKEKYEYSLRAGSIAAGVVIAVTCAITGANGTLHILAGLLVGFGVGLGTKILNRLFPST